MSLFTYLLRIFFFFFFSLRERMYSWRCVTHSRRTKQAQLRAHLLSPGSHVQWQGEGWLRGRQRHLCAACGTQPATRRCQLRLWAAFLSLRTGKCLPGPSRWFWGDRTACVVMGESKKAHVTEQKHRLRLTEPTQSWQTDAPPKGHQSSPAETPTLTNRRLLLERTYTDAAFLVYISGQAIPLRKPALASVELSYADRSEAHVFSFVTLD